VKPGSLRIAGLAPAALAVMMVAYRIYLATATSRLAQSGAGEEALFGLTSDPLWRLEYAAARAMGAAGSVQVMNALGVFLWALVAIVAAWLGFRAWSQKTAESV
jgi:hypothetical protein